jgi:HEAT repeats
MHNTIRLALFAALLGAPLGAQSLGARIARADGDVQFTFPSRPDICGDGRGEIGNLLGKRGQYVGNYDGRGWKRACEPGPGRIVATVSRGRVSKLRVYVGPVPPPSAGVTDLGDVPAADVRAWLIQQLQSGDARPAKESVVPLLVVDAEYPWPELLQAARDDRRPREVQREATFWLGQGAAAHIDPSGDASDEDDVRKSAVFALSQQPREQAVPLLMQIATGNSEPAVRASAMFWLGQTGDSRALDVFAHVLLP